VLQNRKKKGFPTILPCSKLTGSSCNYWIEPGNPFKAEEFLNKSVPKSLLIEKEGKLSFGLF
jgi:hypothetical protein